jgi:hypothetical protein
MASVQAPKTIEYRKATVSTTALSLTGMLFSAGNIAKADYCIIAVEAQPIRLQVSGAAATATDGILLLDGETVTVVGGVDISRISVIRAATATANATVQVLLQEF